jgi:peptidyl-prolyl cis-trans isomerase B (cyclophilin B)
MFLYNAKHGFYEATIFHRVIDGFMIQGGGFNQSMDGKEGAHAGLAERSH